ncbi:MFS general substrate transporter [Aspergillus aculeatinus CBS 121060]|uniref:MFS general substrate transporter n=1 Tax=Aspergillus aculeatinus CBS 121060 TaxID=1448322 RepID=A0ACD1GV70_9EURO|nr:MFS general substrate transporter [Aspergillus aculeatinus CBS 121060]RAH65258.1 MFS general substrate transporter [Aspergillus aculeatinus CBS 121060]
MTSKIIPAKPIGYGWRSSRLFIVAVISLAMFADTFLFSFIIPILPDILQDRLQQPPSHTQLLTSILLSLNALVSILIAPFTGHLADGSKSKNQWMVISWVTNAVGTAITAWSTTVAVLFIGRLIQTLAGSVIWIVGMAILGDKVGAKHLAKALGLAMLFVSAGLLSGPAVSGSLYQFVSYSMTWASAFAVILVGTVLQLLIIGPFNYEMHTEDSSPEESQIRNPLLSSASHSESTAYQTIEEPSSLPIQNVYTLMLRKKRVATALIADTLFAIIIASFETTIPIHIKAVFHWESLQAGLLFLLLQAPSMILVIPAGWLKDRIGMRYPVTIGFLCLAPSLWLLGVPGHTQDVWWTDDENTNRVIYIATLLAIGVWRALLLGFGAVEVLHGANELSHEYPGIFGPHGGYSRSFSMSNISWKLGMFVGPLVSGTLTEKMGYYQMNLVLDFMPTAMNEPQVIALAGGRGDLGHYLQEELIKDPRYSVVILTRQTHPPTLISNRVTTKTTDYTLPSLLHILRTTHTTALISLLRCPDEDYLPLHTTLLKACQLTETCTRFIPSEWAGDIESFPTLPRAYGRTRLPFRAILAEQAGSQTSDALSHPVQKIEYTLLNHGWCMEYFLPAHQSHRRCMPGEFPIDLVAWRYTVRGTGEEAQSWTCRPFERDYRSKEDIETTIQQYEDQPESLELAIAEAEEWTISGATACPKEKTLRQREKFFAGMHFTTVEELLRKAEVEERV